MNTDEDSMLFVDFFGIADKIHILAVSHRLIRSEFGLDEFVFVALCDAVTLNRIFDEGASFCHLVWVSDSVDTGVSANRITIHTSILTQELIAGAIHRSCFDHDLIFSCSGS